MALVCTPVVSLSGDWHFLYLGFVPPLARHQARKKCTTTMVSESKAAAELCVHDANVNMEQWQGLFSFFANCRPGISNCEVMKSPQEKKVKKSKVILHIKLANGHWIFSGQWQSLHTGDAQHKTCQAS